jgi:hypothetical protein
LKIGISNACDEKVGKALTHNSGRDYMARRVTAPKPVSEPNVWTHFNVRSHNERREGSKKGKNGKNGKKARLFAIFAIFAFFASTRRSFERLTL